MATDQERREQARRLKGRNLALLIALLAFVALVYAIALVRMGGF